jgi:hypothetical protein
MPGDQSIRCDFENLIEFKICRSTITGLACVIKCVIYGVFCEDYW